MASSFDAGITAEEIRRAEQIGPPDFLLDQALLDESEKVNYWIARYRDACEELAAWRRHAQTSDQEIARLRAALKPDGECEWHGPHEGERCPECVAHDGCRTCHKNWDECTC